MQMWVCIVVTALLTSFGVTADTSTGITMFRWVPILDNATGNATETREDQDDCARQCLRQCEDIQANFCYGFVIENTTCSLLNSSVPPNEEFDAYVAYYQVVNYMNAPSNQPESCDAEYNGAASLEDFRQTVFEKNHYALFSKAVKLSQCIKECEKIGFDLVSIHTMKQNTFVGDLVVANPRVSGSTISDGAHLGLFLNTTVNEWNWSNGKPVNLLNWAEKEPDNGGGSEYYTALRTNNYQWRDYPMDYKILHCLCAQPVAMAGQKKKKR